MSIYEYTSTNTCVACFRDASAPADVEGPKTHQDHQGGTKNKDLSISKLAPNGPQDWSTGEFDTAK